MAVGDAMVVDDGMVVDADDVGEGGRIVDVAGHVGGGNGVSGPVGGSFSGVYLTTHVARSLPTSSLLLLPVPLVLP